MTTQQIKSAREMPEWCSDPVECGRFLRWMHEHDELGPIELETVWCVLEKPWHWTAEYDRMRNESRSPMLDE
jgi:hypothetical protein